MAGKPQDTLVLACLASSANREMATRLLAEAQLDYRGYAGLEDLLADAVQGVGVLLLEEELLTGSWPARLKEFLADQPAWSDLPVILLTSRTVPGAAYHKVRAQLAHNITVLHRPIASSSLVSVLRLALQARMRQYEIRDLLESLENRVEERTAQLARSNADLEQFAYVASHDLQEPLRMISSFVQMLRDRYESKLDDKGKEYIAYAVDGAKRMQDLIRNLLDYSRSTRQSEEMHPVDMQKVYERVTADLWGKIKDSEVELSHDPLPTVMGDQTMLSQVLLNLIGNAIKFHRPDAQPSIHVGARREDANWIISVKDNGIGIDPRNFDRMFMLFQRLHTRKQYEGTGVGLAIVKKIIERHGGRIWVESQPGQGSTFLFTLQAVD